MFMWRNCLVTCCVDCLAQHYFDLQTGHKHWHLPTVRTAMRTLIRLEYGRVG